MPAKKSPSNNDVMDLLRVQHQEKMDHISGIENRLGDIETQVKYTNGRVTAMEEKWVKAEAIEEYKAKNPPISPVSVSTTTVTQVDWQKIVLGLMGLIGTALAIIAAYGGTH